MANKPNLDPLNSFRFSSLGKISAFFLLISFTLLNTSVNGYGNVGAQFITSESKDVMNYAPTITSVQIPEALGTIEEIFSPKNSADKLVLFIQNAHANYDAESSISKLIHYFQENLELPLVLLEGGEGKLDSLFFKAFPDQKAKERILDDYLKEGDLQGGEVAAILNQNFNTKFYGIESENLYQENKKAFLSALQKKSEILDFLKKEEDVIAGNSRSRFLRPQIKTFLDSYQSFHEEKINLLEYVRTLMGLYATVRATHASPLPMQYPELAIIFAGEDYEKTFQGPEIDIAIHQLIREFKEKVFSMLSKDKQKEINQKIQAYQTNHLDPGELAKTIQEVSQIKIPEMLKSTVKHFETLQSIKGTKLFEELEQLEEELRNTLPQSEEERKILEDYHCFNLLRQFAKLELTHKEWKEIESKISDTSHQSPDSGLWQQVSGFSTHIRFYELALKRDATLFQNAIHIMDKEKAKVALIATGGFHEEGIKAKLKKANIPYVSIRPKIYEIGDKSNYLNAIQNKRSFMKYFHGSLWDALARDFIEKTLSANANLKQWRDRIIQESIREGRITEATNYTRYIDEFAGSNLKKSADNETQSVTRNEQDKIERELRSFFDAYFAKLKSTLREKFDLFQNKLLTPKSALAAELTLTNHQISTLSSSETSRSELRAGERLKNREVPPEFASYEPVREFSRLVLTKSLQREFLRALGSETQVLEIGAGIGELRSLVGDQLPMNVKWIETDQNKNYLSYSRSRPTERRTIQLPNLPFENNSVPFVAGLSILHGTMPAADTQKTIHEVYRALKPSGILFHGFDVLPNIEHEFSEVSEKNLILLPILQTVDGAYIPAQLLYLAKDKLETYLGDSFQDSYNLSVQKFFRSYLANPGSVLVQLSLEQSRFNQVLDHFLSEHKSLIVRKESSWAKATQNKLKKRLREAGFAIERSEEIKIERILDRKSVPAFDSIPDTVTAMLFRYSWGGNRNRDRAFEKKNPGKVRIEAAMHILVARKPFPASTISAAQTSLATARAELRTNSPVSGIEHIVSISNSQPALKNRFRLPILAISVTVLTALSIAFGFWTWLWLPSLIFSLAAGLAWFTFNHFIQYFSEKKFFLLWNALDGGEQVEIKSSSGIITKRPEAIDEAVRIIYDKTKGLPKPTRVTVYMPPKFSQLTPAELNQDWKKFIAGDIDPNYKMVFKRTPFRLYVRSKNAYRAVRISTSVTFLIGIIATISYTFMHTGGPVWLESRRLVKEVSTRYEKTKPANRELLDKEIFDEVRSMLDLVFNLAASEKNFFGAFHERSILNLFQIPNNLLRIYILQNVLWDYEAYYKGNIQYVQKTNQNLAFRKLIPKIIQILREPGIGSGPDREILEETALTTLWRLDAKEAPEETIWYFTFKWDGERLKDSYSLIKFAFSAKATDEKTVKGVVQLFSREKISEVGKYTELDNLISIFVTNNPELSKKVAEELKKSTNPVIQKRGELLKKRSELRSKTRQVAPITTKTIQTALQLARKAAESSRQTLAFKLATATLQKLSEQPTIPFELHYVLLEIEKILRDEQKRTDRDRSEAVSIAETFITNALHSTARAELRMAMMAVHKMMETMRTILNRPEVVHFGSGDDNVIISDFYDDLDLLEQATTDANHIKFFNWSDYFDKHPSVGVDGVKYKMMSREEHDIIFAGFRELASIIRGDPTTGRKLLRELWEIHEHATILRYKDYLNFIIKRYLASDLPKPASWEIETNLSLAISELDRYPPNYNEANRFVESAIAIVKTVRHSPDELIAIAARIRAMSETMSERTELRQAARPGTTRHLRPINAKSELRKDRASYIVDRTSKSEIRNRRAELRNNKTTKLSDRTSALSSSVASRPELRGKTVANDQWRVASKNRAELRNDAERSLNDSELKKSKTLDQNEVFVLVNAALRTDLKVSVMYRYLSNLHWVNQEAREKKQRLSQHELSDLKRMALSLLKKIHEREAGRINYFTATMIEKIMIAAIVKILKLRTTLSESRWLTELTTDEALVRLASSLDENKKLTEEAKKEALKVVIKFSKFKWIPEPVKRRAVEEAYENVASMIQELLENGKIYLEALHNTGSYWELSKACSERSSKRAELRAETPIQPEDLFRRDEGLLTYETERRIVARDLLQLFERKLGEKRPISLISIGFNEPASPLETYLAKGANGEWWIHMHFAIQHPREEYVHVKNGLMFRINHLDSDPTKTILSNPMAERAVGPYFLPLSKISFSDRAQQILWEKGMLWLTQEAKREVAQAADRLGAVISQGKERYQLHQISHEDPYAHARIGLFAMISDYDGLDKNTELKKLAELVARELLKQQPDERAIVKAVSEQGLNQKETSTLLRNVRSELRRKVAGMETRAKVQVSQIITSGLIATPEFAALPLPAQTVQLSSALNQIRVHVSPEDSDLRKLVQRLNAIVNSEGARQSRSSDYFVLGQKQPRPRNDGGTSIETQTKQAENIVSLIQSIQQPMVIRYQFTPDEISRMKDPASIIGNLFKTVQNFSKLNSNVIGLIEFPERTIQKLKLAKPNQNDSYKWITLGNQILVVNKNLIDPLRYFEELPRMTITMNALSKANKVFATDYYADSPKTPLDYSDDSIAADIYTAALLLLTQKTADGLVPFNQGLGVRPKNRETLSGIAYLVRMALELKLAERAEARSA